MSDPIEIRVPDIGDFNDVPVLEILVKPGTRIEPNTPLITLETEKATIDVPAQTSGVVKDIVVRVGEHVSQGSPILTIVSAEQAPSTPGSAPSVVPLKTAMPPSPVPPRIMSPVPSANTPDPVHGLPYTSPNVRARCRYFDIDPKAISGTGPNGRIVESDLDAYLKRLLQEPVSAPTLPCQGGGPTPATDFERFGPTESRALSRIARRAAANLSRNWSTIPHVTNFEEADITDVESFRESVNREERHGPKLTILALLIKASATALREFPEINVSLTDDALIYKLYRHVGFAVDTPAGLVVPVIRDVDRKGLLDIAVEVSELATRAREGKLDFSEMEGGCFTISSLGGVSGTGFTPIINAPEIAILGAARARFQPRWDGKQFVPRLILPLALSWDHRAVSGVPAARFLASIASRLTDPRLILL